MYTYIYTQPLWKIPALMLLLLFAWALLESAAGERRYVLWRWGNGAVLILSLFLVVNTTILSREAGERVLILTPFYRLIGEGAHPEGLRLLVMNAFLFQPLGLSFSAILPAKCSPALRIICTALFGLLLSIGVENLQYRFALGTAEADDVLMNTLGAAIGAAHIPIAALVKGLRKN